MKTKNIAALALLTAILSIPHSLYAQTIEEITETSTGSSLPSTPNAIREKVKEKLESKLNIPQAYLGTITDITGNTYEIKSDKGELQLVSVDPETSTFVRLGLDSKKIAFEDVAIADYIVAMGYVDSNNVLTAIRVLATEPIKPSPRTAIYGQVEGVKNDTLTLRTNSETTEITITKSTEILDTNDSEIEAEDIAISSKAIVTGQPDKESLEARAIKIVQEFDNTSDEN